MPSDSAEVPQGAHILKPRMRATFVLIRESVSLTPFTLSYSGRYTESEPQEFSSPATRLSGARLITPNRSTSCAPSRR
jgi:hypothetical protein